MSGSVDDMRREVEEEARRAFKPRIYTASRALPLRAQMWRDFRASGFNISASWIDEAGVGETADYAELWYRIHHEIYTSHKLVLYARTEDFPLKGALVEVGMAIGLGKPVVVCLPGVELAGDTFRPLGSWIKHRSVKRIDDVTVALQYDAYKDSPPQLRTCQ